MEQHPCGGLPGVRKDPLIVTAIVAAPVRRMHRAHGLFFKINADNARNNKPGLPQQWADGAYRAPWLQYSRSGFKEQWCDHQVIVFADQCNIKSRVGRVQGFKRQCGVHTAETASGDDDARYGYV
ncbi:MAG: hypothetical protein ACP5QA_00725 [Phycisphaerae bacterium]